jgi:hypothetical protein
MIGAKAESVCGLASNAQNLNFNFSPPHTTAQTNSVILHSGDKSCQIENCRHKATRKPPAEPSELSKDMFGFRTIQSLIIV